VTTIAAEQRKQCSACHAEIAWAFTPRGKRMPIDADPHPAGNVVVSVADSGRLECRVLSRIEVSLQPDDVELYRSHFATCPDAQRFRDRKR
jgi:hypothetical protein